MLVAVTTTIGAGAAAIVALLDAIDQVGDRAKVVERRLRDVPSGRSFDQLEDAVRDVERGVDSFPTAQPDRPARRHTDVEPRPGRVERHDVPPHPHRRGPPREHSKPTSSPTPTPSASPTCRAPVAGFCFDPPKNEGNTQMSEQPIEAEQSDDANVVPQWYPEGEDAGDADASAADDANVAVEADDDSADAEPVDETEPVVDDAEAGGEEVVE